MLNWRRQWWERNTGVKSNIHLTCLDAPTYDYGLFNNTDDMIDTISDQVQKSKQQQQRKKPK